MSSEPLAPESWAYRVGSRLNQALRKVGAQLQQVYPPSHHMRPIGGLRTFLEDVKARGFTCERVLDVGAATGTWSRQLLQVYPGAGGLLVEPRPECRAALEAFCAEQAGWRYVSTALADAEGRRPIALWGTASSLRRENVEKAESSISVEVQRCDSLLGAGEAPDVMKLDVEGLELEVLAGAERTLRKVEMLVVEAALFPFGTGRPLLHDVVTFLANRGFFVYDVAGVIRRPYDGAIGLVDLVFAPREGRLRTVPARWQ